MKTYLKRVALSLKLRAVSFVCKNINYAEKNDYYLKIISDKGLTFVPG